METYSGISAEVDRHFFREHIRGSKFKAIEPVLEKVALEAFESAERELKRKLTRGEVNELLSAMLESLVGNVTFGHTLPKR